MHIWYAICIYIWHMEVWILSHYVQSNWIRSKKWITLEKPYRAVQLPNRNPLSGEGWLFCSLACNKKKYNLRICRRYIIITSYIDPLGQPKQHMLSVRMSKIKLNIKSLYWPSGSLELLPCYICLMRILKSGTNVIRTYRLHEWKWWSQPDVTVDRFCGSIKYLYCGLVKWIIDNSCLVIFVLWEFHFCLPGKEMITRWKLFLKLKLPTTFVSDFRVNFFDPPGHGRIGGHYFHARCPYVRTSQKQIRATSDTMHENNDHLLLAGAWWVTLKSPDFLWLWSMPFSMHQWASL